MSVYSTTLASLIKSVALSFDDYVPCTPSSAGTTNTAVCNTLLRADDYYNGMQLHFNAGTLKDTTREVTDFVLSNYTLTFLPAVTSNVAVTDLFQLHKKFTYDHYKEAINRAIEMAKTEYLLNKIDLTSLVSDGESYTYAIPTSFRYICEVRIEDEADDGLFETIIPDSQWQIIKDASAPTLLFANLYTDGCHFGIKGQTCQLPLTTDASICYMPPEYVIQTARGLLMSQRPEYERLLNSSLVTANNERKLMCVPPLPGSRSVWEM